MSETPPQGSLLGNFFFGGGKRPPAPAPSSQKKPDEIPMVYNPNLKKWVPVPDQASQLGLQIASHPINYVESALGGLISELAGRDVIKRSGGEDEIVKMNHDYLSKTVNELGDKDTLRLLQIERFEDYDKDYRQWIEEKQAKENAEKSGQGEGKLEKVKSWAQEKPLEQGFGKFIIRSDRFSASSRGFRKAALASAVGPIINDLNIGEHAEVPYLNKVEQSRYISSYLEERLSQKKGNLEGQLRSVERNLVSIAGVPESDPAMVDLRDKQRVLRSDLANLEKRLNEHEKDKELRQKNYPDKVTGFIAKTQDGVKEKLLEKGKLQKATGAAGQIYSVIKKIDNDPVGFALEVSIVNPIKFGLGRIFGRPKLFGVGPRFGLNLWGKFKGWLEKRVLGRAALLASQSIGWAFRKGSSGLLKLGSRLLGRALGAGLTAAGRIASFIVGKIVIATLPILLAVLALIAAVAIPVFIFFMVVAPLFVGLNPAAVAASPSDLALEVSASKTKGVTANEAITYTIRVTSYIDKVSNIVVTATPDNNFASVAPQDGGSANGLVVTWPRINLTLGQTQILNFVATTNGSVTTETQLQVRVSATSDEGFTPSVTSYVNRQGGSIGADGQHAYPVLGFNSWSCTHSSPNFNAIDIFANPGTPVVATVAGQSQPSENALGGPVVFLYGEDGLSYYYAHLEVGGRSSGRVNLGEIVGYISGDSLRSRNNGVPHVHFSIDSRGIHDGPNTPAGPFLDSVGGTNRCR